MLQLCGSNKESGIAVQGALNLCNIVGPERLDSSGAATDAQGLKETKSINNSLSCLGNVFASLASIACSNMRRFIAILLCHDT
jgi:hypothetical protein